MNKVLDFLKDHKYLMVALVLVGISIVLSITYSNYIVTSIIIKQQKCILENLNIQ